VTQVLLSDNEACKQRIDALQSELNEANSGNKVLHVAGFCAARVYTRD
jgi:hypothetical protein